MKTLKSLMRGIIISLLCLLIAICLSVIGGCTNFKATLPDGTVILYQRVFTNQSAKKADLYYEEHQTGVILWVVIDDPNSRVSPGSLTMREPYTGIELSVDAD